MIYLIGATGKLGSYVHATLSKKATVIPVVRKPSGLRNEIVSDFSDASLAKIFKNAAAVINMAGSVKFYDKKALWESNVTLVRSIVNALPDNALFVHASSISVYGKKLWKKPADESSPVIPDSDYSRSKYEGEKAVAAHSNSIILRIGTVYGPFDDYAMILRMMKKGKMFLIGDGSNSIPFVHIEDAAAVFANALNGTAGVYNIVGDPITQKDVYAVAASALGVKPPEKQISYFMADSVAWVEEKKAMLSGSKPRLTREHIAVLYFDRPFDCTRAKKELGFSPRKTEDGIKQVVKQLAGKL